MLNYVEKINQELKIPPASDLTVLDLFAGCGGLALGFEAVGFTTIGFEKDKDAVATYSLNLEGQCYETELTRQTEYPKAQVIIGGPPCQPFSVGGHQRGIEDDRNGFPIFLAAIQQVQPEIVLFENVRGLLYTNKWYFEEIMREIARLGYIVDYALLNALDYGVPQNRERLFVIGHKSKFTFPSPEKKRFTVAEAIGDLMITVPPESKFLTSSMDEYVKKYEVASKCINPRDLYPDKPARTLTCRNIAAPTGDMHRVKLTDGRRRRLLLREAARLQSFPDWFEFAGTETSQFYQIGNAVPPMLAKHLANSVMVYLLNASTIPQESIIGSALSINNQLSLFQYK